MITVVQSLAEELRRVRIPVATSQIITALEALRHIDLSRPAEVQEALAASLIQKVEHRTTFDVLFRIFFAPERQGHGRPLEVLSDGDLRSTLATALTDNNQHLLRLLAAEAIARYARIEPGRKSAGTFYAFRTLDSLSFEDLLDELLEAVSPETHELSRIDTRARQLALEAAGTTFEQIINGEIRNQLISQHGAGTLAGLLRNPLPEDEDFLTASIDTVARMNTAIAPMIGRLSKILVEEQSRKSQAIDMRRTMRRSLSTGGSPVNISFKPKVPPRPRLVIIADVSGSVANFAVFALQLIYALKTRFSRQRSFVFVDATDEVTDLIGNVHSITEATARINSEHRGIRIDGHSDYGNAFVSFVDQHLSVVDTHTTVLVLGDGRNNYREPRGDALEKIRARSNDLYWLNPESPALWDDGDSAISAYAPHCTGVVECRTIRQLEAFITSLS